jgi:aryl-alcohol dehydrogenase-like predicted oxidoreductase
MEYRALGWSGCAVSSYALGTMTFGAETDETGSFEMLDTFVEAGGTFVDTADVYANGASEQIIGRWLAERPSDVTDRIVLATKARFPMGPDVNDAGLSRRHLRRSLHASLARLDVEHIDLFQAHAWDPLTPLEETVAEFADAISAGLISYWGLSNMTGWQVAAVCAVADSLGAPRPVTLQPQYNLLAREVEWEIVPSCEHHRLGLLPWSPLGGGWLTGKYERDARPEGTTRLGENPERGVEAYDRRAGHQRTWDVLEELAGAADTHATSMGAIALAWLHERPSVTSIILGARTVEQLEANLSAVDVRLTPPEIARLDSVSDPDPADYPYGGPGRDQRWRALPSGS